MMWSEKSFAPDAPLFLTLSYCMQRAFHTLNFPGLAHLISCPVSSLPDLRLGGCETAQSLRTLLLSKTVQRYYMSFILTLLVPQVLLTCEHDKISQENHRKDSKARKSALH